MNKQEALKQIEEQRDMILDLHGWGVFGYIKGIINQLDEPQKIEIPKVEFKKYQKVKVPQCVADWIKYCKRTGVNLYNALDMGDLYFYNYANQKDDLKLKEFFETDTNQDLFARAWLDGYEVEKEKRYRVKIKGEIEGNLLVYGLGIKRYFFARTYDSSKRGEHTRKELEDADFGWVFDCPGVEVTEVE